MNFALKHQDSRVYEILNNELQRQHSEIQLIASENYVSKAVMEITGSIFTNKYAEGYPGKRYYNGCEYVDEIELLAQERLCELFGCKYANVQPHSGSQANQAVLLALLKPGDSILAMSLNAGGHLTHGAKPNLSGKWFNVAHYGVSRDNYLIDYDEVERLAKEHNPKLIICGFSAYSRALDFRRFKDIAKKVGAYLMADIAHIAGIIAAKRHESPFPHCDVVTSTTHKTLRGPRGGIILSNEKEISDKINSAVFPGLQGGPLMHVIAAKAVAFQENLDQSFSMYIDQVLKNAICLSNTLISRGYDVLTGGTENHLLLLDLRKHKIQGNIASDVLEKAGITANKNAIPFDETSPTITSGIRLGTPAITTRGFKEKEATQIGHMIADIMDTIYKNYAGIDETVQYTNMKVKELCDQFPIY